MAPLPLRPQASRSSSGSSSHEQEDSHDLYPRQAGRSTTIITAQQSAQSLREATRTNQRNRSRSPSKRNVLQKKNRQGGENLAPPPPPTRKHPLFVPNVPSPLNPISNVPSAQLSANSKANEVSSTGQKQITHFKSSPALRVTVPEIRLSAMSDPETVGDVSRLRHPRSVRDLGWDYTRYFNPFPSQGSSVQALSPQTFGDHLMSSTDGSTPPNDVARRLSDPFRDSKRLSNPFECAEDMEAAADDQSEPGHADETRPKPRPIPMPTRNDTPMFVRNADPEKMPLFLYLDDRLGAPDYSFPLITDQKEDDDDLHMPQWDDDIRLKPKLKDHFTRESIVSTFGMFLMMAGLLFVFVILPILSYTGVNLIDYAGETPLSEMPHYPPGQPWSWVTNRKIPLLTNVRTGPIDPDTPNDAMTKVGVDGEEYVLVFSDEFNKKNRTFYPGDDAYWSGFEGWYGATQDLEWYTPDAINTGDGCLLIQLDAFRSHNLNFRSGMLQSWNQICMKGGILEVSMSLPGPAGAHGLWPGVWTMGNLGRPGYLATTDGLWPYTYSECDVGITPNQSSTDGLSELPGQRLASCTCAGEDHPSPGIGRGAPEIDIAEVSADWASESVGVATQSYQVAPFDIWYYPNYHFMQNPNYNLSLVNSWTGGPFQQAVSTTSMLNNEWYDGKEFQRFAFEYKPGDDKDAFVAWTIGNDEMMRFDARAVGPNGNIGQRIISQEPMSIIMNLGISNNWVDIVWSELRFPTTLRIDYVRWYQLPSQQIVTCDPPGYETTQYIANHPRAYLNNNFTTWAQAGYEWPRNEFMHGCRA